MKTYLQNGGDVLAEYPNFRLIGREAELNELCSILTRVQSNSVIVSGPGGVGISALALGLQARKADPDAPFDIVAKRFFWLDVDGIFALGDNDAITKEFRKILSILDRTPDSVMVVEDTLVLIEGLRNAGLMHIINALTSMVKAGRTQLFLEAREGDLASVLKTHSDFHEHFTLMDLKEPVGDGLLRIVTAGVHSLEDEYGIRVDPSATLAAIDLTTKYKGIDTGISRAQPELSITLVDRAMSSYALHAHSIPPMLDELETERAKWFGSTDPQAAERIKSIDETIARHKADFAQTQATLKKLYASQREGEKAIVVLTEKIEELMEVEKHRALEPGKDKSFADSLQEIGEAAGHETPEIRELRSQLVKVEEAVSINRREFDLVTKSINDRLALVRDHVVREFSSISGIAESKLKQDESVKLLNLKNVMLSRIYGQDEAVVAIDRAIKVFKKGRRTGRPLPFLYCGPSGVGKTEMAKTIAEGLLDTDRALNRFDMSEYMEKNDITKLIGAPPGYEGFSVGGILTNSVRKNPYQVILFDEIEKGHPDIFNLFLNILDDGRCTDNLGRKVEFGDCIVVMTTNIGQTHALDTTLSPEEIKESTMVDLLKHFRPEFLNRFEGRENIFCFNRLNQDSIQNIARRELIKINQNYASRGIEVSFPDKALIEFCQAVYSPEIGARGVPGKVKAIESLIVEKLLVDDNFHGHLSVGWEGRFTTNWMGEAKAA